MLEDDIIVETESVLIELNLKNLVQIQGSHLSIIDKSELKRMKSSELDFREAFVIS
jgi:hypothetical protein